MSQQVSKASLSGSNVLYFLIAFRICNALLLRTFFQPDEYFQSLEPAWHTVFGDESGAWITWEWNQRLRSSLHPFFFAAVYRVADLVASALDVGPSIHSELLLAAPKVVQAVLAALGDFYTWKLAQRSYGEDSQASYGALFLTVCSPWQFFCSTRTLSNSIETTLTVVALYLWPFNTRTATNDSRYRSMCMAFAFAALATILRPTNVIIWLVIAMYTASYTSNFKIRSTIRALLFESSAALISGLAMLSISIIADRIFYNEWTFPPARFIHFNVVQSLAVFYGRNRPDYYITEGLPLLLTTSLPFAIWGWGRAILGISDPVPAKTKSLEPTTTSTKSETAESMKDNTTNANTNTILRPLALSITLFTTLMSLISHKEVRFIYPLLPALHVLAAAAFGTFFHPFPYPRTATKTALLSVFVLVNTVFALYISLVHQRGVVDVTHFLRKEYEHHHLQHHLEHHLPQQTQGQGHGHGYGDNTSVLFLMPCHSTPWRSHLIHTGIDARALTCDPPIEIPFSERAAYLDEADQFYAEPVVWMETYMRDTGSIRSADQAVKYGGDSEDGCGGTGVGDELARAAQAAWPEYLVFFAQLEPVLGGFLDGTRYVPFWRGFNTHWHDDWRREGDVVVWRLES